MGNGCFKTFRYFQTAIDNDQRTVSFTDSESSRYSLTTLQCDLAVLVRTVCGPTLGKLLTEDAGNVAHVGHLSSKEQKALVRSTATAVGVAIQAL